jgi:hypothetical protein
LVVRLAKPELMKWNGNIISDHNRDVLSIEPTRIENKQRMADGTMRWFYVGDKRTFSTTWENLPGTDARTVAGTYGADNIKNFYLNNPGAFTLLLTFANGTTETYTVRFADFSFALAKRGVDNLYNISVSLEEV